MSNRRVSRNVALTAHFDQYVQAKVRSGRYRSASEVVGEGLRLLEQRDRAFERHLSSFRDAIEHGWQQLEQGDVVAGPSVFEEIRKMSKARRARRRTRR